MKLIRVTIYLISLILVAIAAYQAGYTAQKPVVIIDRAPAPAAPLPGPIVPRASPSPEPVGRILGVTPEEAARMRSYRVNCNDTPEAEGCEVLREYITRYAHRVPVDKNEKSNGR